MARTVEGETLTRQHRQRQLSLRASTVQELRQAWELFDPRELHSFDDFLDVAAPLIRGRNRDAAGIAATYFEQFRRAEDVGGSAEPRLAERPPSDTIRETLRTTGYFGTLRAVGAGFSPRAALRQGLTRVAGSATRLVLGGARDTIIRSTAGDRRSPGGWRRATAASPCHFCRMIAGRGAVFSENTADFQAHDHCMCQPEPVYRGSGPSRRNQQFEEEWTQATRGLRGKEAVRAFRRHVEGRDDPTE